MEITSGKRVGIIGAGIAGLVTAKVMQADGFEVTVIEKQKGVGGVWAPSRAYAGLRANSSRDAYAYSDFPYPCSADEFPTAEQVRNYLESYVDHFQLRSHIRLSTEVVSVSIARNLESEPRFRVLVRHADAREAAETLGFDFVVVCNGVFSEPYLPHVPGAQHFAGRLCHSSQLTDVNILKGKRVVVVGGGKSALDCACLAAQHARCCTLLCRRPHWMVPQRILRLIRSDRLIMNRMAEAFLPYHRLGRVEALLHGPLSWIVRLFWRGQSWMVRRQLHIPPMMMPMESLAHGAENLGVGCEFYDLLRTKQLIVKRGSVATVTAADTIKLDTGESVKADLVIFATGWHQYLGFLDADLRARVIKDGRFHLYRHILPPEEPGLGFVGYASSSACQFTSEIAAHWLSQHFRSELNLPSRSAMELEIERVERWLSSVFPARAEGYFIGRFLAHYIDELMADMGLNTKRAGNVVLEYLAPLWPSRYQHLETERLLMRARQNVVGMDTVLNDANVKNG